MKRIILLAAFALLVIGMTFAQGVSEEITKTTSEYTVDLSTGTSSSDLVSAAFNEDGNLELTYEGTDSIEITLTGTLDGTLIVKSDNADYTLVLDGVTITGKTLPAIQLKSETTATIYGAAGSSNTISDSAENEKKGAITSSGSIIFDGADSSTIAINVYKKHGVKADGGVTVNGGNLVITGDEAAEGNMISADLFFIMNGGNVRIYANGNVHASESKGIKVNGVEGTGAGQGYVEINDGNLTINAVGKAITAGWKLSEDATTETTDDDPVPNVYINGGTIYITTTGTPYEYSDEESLSPEGIEAKNIVYINGGTIYLDTTDDSLNATNAIIINGGYIYSIATANDSIDSNGTIEINGGTVITMSSSMEQAFDCDNDANFTYTGGIYVGAGNGNNMPKGEATTGYSIAYGDGTFYAGDQIAVLDSEGNVVIGFIVPYDVTSLTSIVFGTDAFKQGETYTIALGAFENQSDDGLMEAGSTFRAQEEVVTMDLTENTVSQGYIGMNVGTGDFGGMPQGGMMGGPGMGGGPEKMLQTLLANASEIELPEGATLPENLDSEEAIQLALYILANYVDTDSLTALFQNNMPNGDFTPPDGGMPGQMPNGAMPDGMPMQAPTT